MRPKVSEKRAGIRGVARVLVKKAVKGPSPNPLPRMIAGEGMKRTRGKKSGRCECG